MNTSRRLPSLIKTRALRLWIAWAMLLVLILSVLIWYFSRDSLPREIVIATAVEGGEYHELGARLAELLEQRTGHSARTRTSAGSKENADLLRQGDVHVAILQAGSTNLDKLARVAPLYPDVVHVVVRRPRENDNGIQRIQDLVGKRVLIGKPKSGMQHAAQMILRHYRIIRQVELREDHFTELLSDDACDAAIVTTGLENDDMRRVMESGGFDLLPLDSSALAWRYVQFDEFELPARFWPPLPRSPVPTVATTAMVVVREDAPSPLINHLLDVIYEDNLREHFPSIISQSDAARKASRQLHPVARRYHDPYVTYGILQGILESIVAGKELLFALGAGLYLAWDRWRRLKEKELQAEIDAQKERLDVFLDRTLLIERQQIEESDPGKLQNYLDEVTEIKLRALDQLSHEGLRGDRTFSIFLMQCANLISKIQMKIMHFSAKQPDDDD